MPLICSVHTHPPEAYSESKDGQNDEDFGTSADEIFLYVSLLLEVRLPGAYQHNSQTQETAQSVSRN